MVEVLEEVVEEVKITEPGVNDIDFGDTTLLGQELDLREEAKTNRNKR